MLHASKEVGLEVNTQKMKYMVTSCYQNAGQITVYSLLIKPLKMWQSSCFWEQQ